MIVLDRVAGWLGGLAGWRRWLAAALAGALTTLALPPFYVFPALIVAVMALTWLLDGAARAARPWRATLALGWWFGFAHFVTGLYWISNALLVDAASFGWLVPFAVAGLSAYFAVFPAAAVMAAGYARPGGRRAVTLAAAWTIGEVLRGTLLTGFPWNPLGSTLQFADAPMQAAALIGAFGLTFLAVLIAALPATLAGAGRPASRVWLPSAMAVTVLAALWAGGALRLAGAPAENAQAPMLRIVQGAIDQKVKWQPDRVRAHFRLYLDLSRAPGSSGAPPPSIVVWPETAVPAVYDGSQQFLKALAQAVPPDGTLITGVVRSEGSGAARQIWNSVIVVGGRAQLLATYDKHHLVPFGEYVPLARFNPVPKLTEGRVDFSAGPGPVTLSLPNVGAFSPLVCYEAVFPGAVVAAEGAPPQFLLNLTNDAWFGVSTGPYQHLAAARLRAVEQGLPLVRAANTGISALIDSHGRMLARLDLGVRGVLDVAVPGSAATLFSATGNLPVVVMCLLFGLFAGWKRRM